MLLLAAVVHIAYSQYYVIGNPEEEEEEASDLSSYDESAISPAGLSAVQPIDFDSEYTLIPVQIVPVMDDVQPYPYQRETRSKKGKVTITFIYMQIMSESDMK